MTNLPALPENLWTIGELAKALRSSTSWVYKAVERNEIPHVRLGSMIRFDPNAIRAWLASKSSAVGAPT